MTADEKIAAALSDEGQTYKGYPVSELRKAFKVVADPTDWKAPIHAPLYDGADQNLYKAAVEYFTGTKATFGLWRDTLICQADGYRRGPCGDH